MVKERLIVLCDEFPKRFDGDNIYVTKTGKGIGDIEVRSALPFVYTNFALSTEPPMGDVCQVTNNVGDINGYYRIPRETVLDALLKRNDGAKIAAI